MQKILRNKFDNFGTFNKFFIKRFEYVTVDDLHKVIDIKNNLDPNLKIYNVSTLDKAGPEDISFLSNTKYIDFLSATKAGFCFITEKYLNYLNKNTLPVIVENPHYAYSVLLDLMYFVPMFLLEPGISHNSNVDSTAKIGKNVEIQAGVFIGSNVIVGDNCKICANAVINNDCKIGNNTFIGSNSNISYAEIGDNTVIHNGASIGQCGFGFVHDKGFNYKIPQIGVVKIGNFVEIGANTTIDRGAFNDTIIGDNTKIDNLVQIAHGVSIGRGCFIAAQSGISGSTNVRNFVQIGGQTGIAGHIEIGNFVQIAAQSGVMKNIESNSVIAGTPSMPIRDWHKTTIFMKNIINNKKNEGNDNV